MRETALERAKAMQEEFRQGLKGDSEVYRHAFEYPRELMIGDMARVLAVSLPFTLLLPIMIYFKSEFTLNLPAFLSIWFGFFLLMALLFSYINISSHLKMPGWILLVLTRNYLIYYLAHDKGVDVVSECVKGNIGFSRHLKLEKIASVKRTSGFMLTVAGGRRDLCTFSLFVAGPEGRTRAGGEWLVPIDAAPRFFRNLKELNARIALDPALPGANV